MRLGRSPVLKIHSAISASAAPACTFAATSSNFTLRNPQSWPSRPIESP